MSGKRQHPAVFAIEHPLTGERLYPVRGRMWTFGLKRLLTSLGEYGDYIEVEPDLKTRQEMTGIAPEALRSDVPDLVLNPGTSQHAARRARDRMELGNWPEFFIKEKSFGRKVRRPEYGQPARTWWPNTEVGHNRSAKGENRAMFGTGDTFATPKPERLLERIIHIATNPGDVVLDAFAGSGTTAAVAQKMGRRWVTCELMEDTFNRFTRPRLEKVVNNEDQGGITLQKEERADATEDGLPEGLTPEEAQKFTSLLNKTIKNADELKKNPAVKQLKAMTKTKPVKGVVNWRGGGGFQVAHLEPACFDYDPEVALTTLTEHATGDLLVRSVAAQLRFALTPNDLHFDGKRGREHLVVVEGVLDEEKIDEVMAHLTEGHSVLFAATVVDDFAREHVRSFKNGSRVVHVPLEVFPYSDAAEEEK